MCLGVSGLLQSLQWSSSVGCHSQSFSSGIPVWDSFTYVSQWCSSVPYKHSLGRPVVSQCSLDQPVAFQWQSSVHWTSQCRLAQGKVYVTSLTGRYRSPMKSDAVAHCGVGIVSVFRTVTCTSLHTSHGDVIKWKYFPRYWFFVWEIHLSPMNSPHKGQWRGALMFSLICAWINGWVSSREAGDLRRHCAVIVIDQWNGFFNVDCVCH